MRAYGSDQMVEKALADIEILLLCEESFLGLLERMVEIDVERQEPVFAKLEAGQGEMKLQVGRDLSEEDLDAVDLHQLADLYEAGDGRRVGTAHIPKVEHDEPGRGSVRRREAAADQIDHPVGGAEEQVALQLNHLDGIAVLGKKLDGGGRAIDGALPRWRGDERRADAST